MNPFFHGEGSRGRRDFRNSGNSRICRSDDSFVHCARQSGKLDAGFQRDQ